MSQFFMYVLLCKDQTFYTGYTVDLEKRIATHNAGKGAKYKGENSRDTALR